MLEKMLDCIPESHIIFIISFILFVFGMFRKNSNFIDVKSIFKDHFLIFKGSWFQIILLFVMPAFLSLAIVKHKIIDTAVVESLNIIVTLLMSVLLTILGIVCGLTYKKAKQLNDESAFIYNTLLNQTFNSILFECIIGVAILILAIISLFVGADELSWGTVIVSLVLYYLTITMVLNLLVVFKRIVVLFEQRE